MLPFTPAGGGTWNPRDVVRYSFQPQFIWAIIATLGIWLFVDSAMAQVQGDPNQTILQTLIKWTPLMMFGAPGEFGGFILNIVVSFVAMALGTFLGLWLGIGQVSKNALIRRVSWSITQLF